MNIKNLIKDANDILGLPLDWNNFANDEHYRQLFRCACLVLNTITGRYDFTDNDKIGTDIDVGEVSASTLIYGILTEYSFIAGMLNEWKVWRAKYEDGLFKAASGTKIIPRGF